MYELEVGYNKPDSLSAANEKRKTKKKSKYIEH